MLPGSAQYSDAESQSETYHLQDEPAYTEQGRVPSRLIATMTVQKPSIWTQKESADGRATVDAAAYAHRSYT